MRLPEEFRHRIDDEVIWSTVFFFRWKNSWHNLPFFLFGAVFPLKKNPGYPLHLDQPERLSGGRWCFRGFGGANLTGGRKGRFLLAPEIPWKKSGWKTTFSEMTTFFWGGGGEMLVFEGVKGSLETIRLRWPPMTQGTISFCSEHCTLCDLLLCQMQVVLYALKLTLQPYNHTQWVDVPCFHTFFIWVCNSFISMCPRRLYQDILNQLKTMRFLYATPWCQLSWLESDTFLEKERVFFVLWIGPPWWNSNYGVYNATWCTGIGPIRCYDSNDSDHTKRGQCKAQGSWELVLGICVCFDPTSAAKSGRKLAPQHHFAVLLVYLSDPARNRWVASVITQADYRINNMKKHGLDFWIFGWWGVCSELRTLSTWVCSFHCVRVYRPLH